MDQDEPIETDEDIRNDLWFKENLLKLIQDYPNQWIGVCGQQVISSGSSKSAVDAEARGKVGSKMFSLYFVPPSSVIV